ncbi:MAG: hypothetical protein KME45_06695 [Stenomitos rutilans HA7619-LM2]|jgi:hypothetical protein|nr:hypothetical protein [Stenomitos rutilans HA7619-LM2]
MPDVLIVVESVHSEVTAQMISVLKAAMLSKHQSETACIRVDVISSADLAADVLSGGKWASSDHLLCPLTLHLPPALSFPAQAIYSACRDVAGLRQQLAAWQYAIGSGNFWLPIALTAKGPLYAEVIGLASEIAASADLSKRRYTQPVHLNDAQRQPLYALGQRLLRSLSAPPAVYLMQFGWQGNTLCFDRLFPFPAAPAIASLKVQTPDLLACHWACLSSQPIVDLVIDQLD